MFPQDEFKKYAVRHKGINSLTLEKFQSVTNSYLTPNIIEERQLNIASMDVFSRLMMDRIIFLGVPIDDDVANIIMAQLLFLETSDPGKDIQIYFNSPGGSVYAGLGIYDTMQYISCDVATTCTGLAASMSAVLLTAGTKGKRSALRHSRIMIHQPPQFCKFHIAANFIPVVHLQHLPPAEHSNTISASSGSSGFPFLFLPSAQLVC